MHPYFELGRCFSDLLNRRAFKKHPLVFLRGVRGINDEKAQWLALEDCIWGRSVLRYKHALRPSLDQYRGLFRDTLDVPNATIDMLVTDIIKTPKDSRMDNEEKHEYIKDLLQDIARLWRKDATLKRLYGKKCWPCCTPSGEYKLCSMGDFYVNDRQDLFEIFSGSHTFLNFDFDTSKKLTELLHNQDCSWFLSDTVFIETEACEPLEHYDRLEQDFRGRAVALVKFVILSSD